MSKYTSEHHHNESIVQLFQDGQYLYHKGLKAYRERNLSRASKLIQRAIFLEPDNTGMLSQLAVIYTEMGFYQQSNELLDFILKNMNEKMTECHYFKANNYAHLGLFQEAYKAAETYLNEDPNGEFMTENMELLDLLDMGEESDHYSEYDQDDLILKQDQAKSFLENGQLQESIEMLEEIINDYPEFWSAYNNLALAYFYAGDIYKAKLTVMTVLEKNDGNLHALCNLLIFFHYERKDEQVRILSEQLSNIYPMLNEQRYKLGATFSLIGMYDLGYRWLKSLYRTGFEGDVTFYYWLACSAYFTDRIQFAERIWGKMEAEYPGHARIEPWKERLEKQPSLEERLAAYYVSGRKGEKDQLQAVLDSKMAKTEFEDQFVRLLLYGENKKTVISKDALFAYRTAKAIEEADCSVIEEDAMCFWIFHVIQQMRASGVQLRNPSGLAATIYYIWKTEQHERLTKAETAKLFNISSATLTKYERVLKEHL
ncbi:tetratricopeptide repeat protein [Bacillus changyiensis]|uniref:tetratricopeptide repeat protein n=1 Tax=Bacillus changyiensis TaxID=3004103 RepID=UPI0022E1863E|nr:tetratricopeptide repeat protein [Bacillus changyiensis]MDA1476509.1 tetratricopeptide repeat protein [Bacillus changyiensis]